MYPAQHIDGRTKIPEPIPAEKIKQQRELEQTPLGRLGTAQDVADAAVYLASAGFVTGQVLGVDGGFY